MIIRQKLPESILNGDGTAYLPLTKGKMVLIDEIDLPLVQNYFWHASNTGYAASRIEGIIWTMHRWLNKQELQNNPKILVDHKDRNGLNNRRNNMRITNQTGNMQNTERCINHKGISVDRTHNRYKAYYKGSFGGRINIGTYKTLEEAQKALAEVLARK